jgi:hypothetical protein
MTLRYAALATVLLALAGCKDINEGMNLLEGKPVDAQPVALAYEAGSPVIAEIIQAEVAEPVGPPAEEGIDYLMDWGLSPDGEYYATGWNCTNVPGYRKCAGNMHRPN